MRLAFLDREKETARLRRAVGSAEGTFCCVYGRRRCGKSRLLQEALPAERTAYYVADEREAVLQRAAVAAAMAPLLHGMEQVVYPDWASLLNRWWREAPAGSILVLDELPYLVKASTELPSLLQRLVDRHPPAQSHLVVCGSSLRMMQGLVLDARAPLYGRAREILDVKPLGMFWAGRALGLSAPRAIVDAFAVWGGVPRYWELAAEGSSLWQSVEELVLDPLGVLHNEPQRLLLDDMRDTVQAASILALVGAGCCRPSEIAARLQKPATSLTRPVERLLELGLLRRETPFGAPARSPKRTLYRIADPFLAFWFRYVEPNRSRLEAGLVAPVRAAAAEDFPMHAGAVWEAQARDNFARMRLDGADWMPAGRWWGPGTDRRPLEIDVVAESADRRTLFVGEAKLRAGAEEAGRLLQELDGKARRLPFAGEYERIVTRLLPAFVEGNGAPPGVVPPDEVIAASR